MRNLQIELTLKGPPLNAALTATGQLAKAYGLLFFVTMTFTGYG